MAKIRAILFDVGGVLLTNGWDRAERADLFREYQLDHDAFELRHLGVNAAWEKGEITMDEYLDETLFYQPRSFTKDQFIASMKAESQLLPHSALGVVRSLAAVGEVKLVMLSNESRELMDHRIQAFGMQQDFSAFLVSAYVGLRKPDPKIFRLALDVIQVSPEETVFVDDRRENAEAASTLGIHGMQYEGPQHLQQELIRLGLNPAALSALGDCQLSGIES